MKPVSLFFLLCFSFLLLSGSAYRCLPVSFQSNCSLPDNLLKGKHQAQSISKPTGSCVTSANTSGTNDDRLNAVEPEDSDDEHSKFPEWIPYLLQSFHHSLSGNLHRYRKDQLPVCLHFALMASGKYITYRVIRI